MDQKVQCIADDRRDRLPITARCALDSISRKTG
jgi:hypothetical protein